MAVNDCSSINAYKLNQWLCYRYFFKKLKYKGHANRCPRGTG